MAERAFLSEQRRRVVRGKTADEMGISEETRRQYKYTTKQKARAAIAELIEVAASPEIDNGDIFDPDQLEVLITTLLIGTGGLSGEEVPSHLQAWNPDPEYANRAYVAINHAIRYAPDGWKNQD
jgi:hypothetical protein